MRFLDFSSWQSVLTSVAGLLFFVLIMMGIRILMMLTIQARQQRVNRQINERLKTLIAAYKVLGGSFTGDLIVNPGHKRDLRDIAPELHPPETVQERMRQIRDAVEASLSDIILLGTEEQVRLAAQAARDMAEGKPVETATLVISLRNFIRQALDLEAIPDGVAIPNQGPTRQQAAGRSGRQAGEAGRSGGGGGGGAGGGMSGGGMGMGMGGARQGDI
ncbi:hypothetical protein Q9295_14155 [Xinfangfangia sp. CPCC 101601]|uniref:Uncharacterized protein n=1 Tax=Pseudogemmobacter lacusdianii TaxID=3069608 RepID=A0ABU0W0J3_9RHOB|nr:hypothetical protein [Xinfangfangia sp. CPCC 101601]MDQ2067518.1 hypothetical protein [Xinfangfangia sp. CPCC 101601]